VFQWSLVFTLTGLYYICTPGATGEAGGIRDLRGSHRKMFDIEEEIEIYAESEFDPREEAQRFFASNGEAEVTRKLNEMTGVQVRAHWFICSSEKHEL
jgi:hypothetical protein